MMVSLGEDEEDVFSCRTVHRWTVSSGRSSWSAGTVMRKAAVTETGVTKSLTSDIAKI